MTVGDLINVTGLDSLISIHAEMDDDWTDEKRCPYFNPKPCRMITWQEYKELEGREVTLVQLLTWYCVEPDSPDYIDVTYR